MSDVELLVAVYVGGCLAGVSEGFRHYVLEGDFEGAVGVAIFYGFGWPYRFVSMLWWAIKGAA